MNLLARLLSVLVLLTATQAFAAKPTPMKPTELPLERPLTVLLQVQQTGLYVQQEVQDPYNINVAPSPGFSAGSAAAAGLIAGAINAAIAQAKYDHDQKRLALITAKMGERDWGGYLRERITQTLSADGLAQSFEFKSEPGVTKVGNKKFDETGRALGTLRAHIAFSPNLRGIRVRLFGQIEDRRVIRNTQMRLVLERKPLRVADVEYLISLPDDVDLKQSARTQRWVTQDPQAFNTAIEHAIDAAIALFAKQWLRDETDAVAGESVSFMLDAAIGGRGRLASREPDRVLISGNGGRWHSVPAELLDRGFFD